LDVATRHFARSRRRVIGEIGEIGGRVRTIGFDGDKSAGESARASRLLERSGTLIAASLRANKASAYEA